MYCRKSLASFITWPWRNWNRTRVLKTEKQRFACCSTNYEFNPRCVCYLPPNLDICSKLPATVIHFPVESSGTHTHTIKVSLPPLYSGHFHMTQNTRLSHLHNFNVHILECGGLGTRLANQCFCSSNQVSQLEFGNLTSNLVTCYYKNIKMRNSWECPYSPEDIPKLFDSSNCTNCCTSSLRENDRLQYTLRLISCPHLLLCVRVGSCYQEKFNQSLVAIKTCSVQWCLTSLQWMCVSIVGKTSV